MAIQINVIIGKFQMIWAHSNVGVGEISQNGQARENTEVQAQRKNATDLGRWDTENCEGKRIEWDGVTATATDREKWRAGF